MIEGLLKDSASSSRKRLAQNSHFSTQAMLALLILKGSKRKYGGKKHAQQFRCPFS